MKWSARVVGVAIGAALTAAPIAFGQGTPPPTQGDPTCNPTPERTPGEKGTIRFTKQALVIQQGIDSAALRRLNAANDWIDAGIEERDLCGGAFGPDAFQAGIPWAGGSTHATGQPSPRPLDVAKPRKKSANFSADLRQVRINDRISRALLARAEATQERINNLTGADLKEGAALIQLVALGVQDSRPLYPGLMVSGALPAEIEPRKPSSLGDIRPLPPIGGVRATVGQLRKTQQRSQRAIVIANEVIDLITSGLTEEQFKAGSIGSPRLTPAPPPTPGAAAAPAAPAPTPAPTTPGDIYNCGDFPLPDGTTAQQYLDRFPSDPSRLDGDKDGVACE